VVVRRQRIYASDQYARAKASDGRSIAEFEGEISDLVMLLSAQRGRTTVLWSAALHLLENAREIWWI
jgi:hypothetical protein